MTLTESDWESRAAELSDIAIVSVFISAFAGTVAYALAFPFSICITIVLVATIALFILIFSNNKSSIWYYVFRFPGALWHHYLQGGGKR